jgi:hypothetical protein
MSKSYDWPPAAVFTGPEQIRFADVITFARPLVVAGVTGTGHGDPPGGKDAEKDPILTTEDRLRSHAYTRRHPRANTTHRRITASCDSSWPAPTQNDPNVVIDDEAERQRAPGGTAQARLGLARG